LRFNRLTEIMSGIIGHTIYAVLAAKSAEARKLPIAPVIRRHFPSYLSGSYLGCDVQTVPAAVCVDSGEHVGYGSGVPERSPVTGGLVKPWRLPYRGREVTPREIHDTFYGRSHLILGWSKDKTAHTIGWNDYLDFASDVAGDALELFGPSHRALAWVLGWMTHVTGDGLIKSVLRGINLHLIDGVYTATNRPVQDLVSFNQVGITDLGLDWEVLLDEAAKAPVEPVQLHYMRAAVKRGRLAAHFPDGWEPELEPLLRQVLAQNHRYQQIRNARIIRQLTLDAEGNCDAALSQTANGLSYDEMLAAAENAKFQNALWQIGEIIADGFEKVIARQSLLQELPQPDEPTNQELSERWSVSQ
jgi:hypothetical protein